MQTDGRPASQAGPQRDAKHSDNPDLVDGITFRDFVDRASHDIRTPLRAIASFSKFLDDEYRSVLDETGQQYVETIARSAARLYDLIHDLRVCVLSDADAVACEPVDLNQTLHDVTADLQTRLTAKNVTVHADKLPRVNGNQAQLQLLFFQLMNNALQYGCCDHAEIRIHSQVGQSSWTAVVEDDGPGIHGSALEQVFEPFRRLVSYQESPGSGLGLTASRRIAHQLGGKLWAESEPDQGCRLCFSLPLSAVLNDGTTAQQDDLQAVH